VPLLLTRSNRRYIKDFSLIAKNYFKTFFVFDILSCVPILAAKMYFLING